MVMKKQCIPLVVCQKGITRVRFKRQLRGQCHYILVGGICGCGSSVRYQNTYRQVKFSGDIAPNITKEMVYKIHVLGQWLCGINPS